MQKVNILLQIILIAFFGLFWQVDLLPAFQAEIKLPVVIQVEDETAEPLPLMALCNLRYPPIPDEIVNYAPEMPYLASCDYISIKEEKMECSDREIYRIIAENFRPPTANLKAGMEGVVSFVVHGDGDIWAPEVVRSVNPEFDAEMRRVVYLLPRFIPGKKEGRIVPVRLKIPFRVGSIRR
ncbi:energy transducer TonB [Flavilitoribacter nigricans]|uniref:TonB C-terminal domain-containing protein n=1 Tax=Flavilitoribacter nigricans (strain ATCC 23147 / DSM 23189 / NBRC 102662 / NCIMB 1420 / SS-2) TaxID=1122177 RepID=A0A2D0NG22_FLAN2|nr:energy transducer TonB [Flavilitoribacter nigricans]PHN07441.1 hypothetical protein CRP01_07385 [Flavilitoribacter nigricans DSM 23189 = NBRC 102662]